MKSNEKQSSFTKTVEPSNNNSFESITYLSCYLSLKKIKLEFGDATFKQYRQILSEVCEEYNLWKSISDKEALSRISLENETKNPNLKKLINETEFCFEYCDRIYFFNNNEIIPCTNNRYFLLLTICLNNYTAERIQLLLSHQYSIYPNKKEFLNNLRLNILEYSGKIILSTKALSVIEWIEEAIKTPLGKEFIKLEVFVKPHIIEIIYTSINNHFISNIDKDIFYNHFLTNNPNLLPINQIENRYDFICLFDALAKYMNKKILNTKNGNSRCDKWLSEHCTFEGSRLSAKDISTIRAKENAKDKDKKAQPRSIQTINEIIKTIQSALT